MFKRVEKRRRKQEEEEELGLDEDMKEVLGMNDTDSDESESDSDSDSDGNEAEEEEAQEEDAGEADEDEDSSDEEDAAEEPPISVREALKDPVYVVSLQPNIKACIVCPGKLIKSAEILTRHRESKAHERRWRQFIEFAKSSKAAPDGNAWDVLKLKAEEKPKLSLTPSTVSKRSEKREKQKLKMEARRERKREAKIKAKAKAVETATEGGEPPKKKRKLDVKPPPTEVPATDPADAPKIFHKSGKGRSPRNDRLKRQGKLGVKKVKHEPPGGRGSGNGKKKAHGEKRATDERGKKPKRDNSKSKTTDLKIFD